MATLTKDQKLFIVRALAVFNTPTETVKLVKEEYDISLNRQNVEAYDPTKRVGKDLSQELKGEFEATRKEFLDQPKNIPISNQAVRLQEYQKLLESNRRNPMMVLKIMEQAAKETGGLYTNKQEVDHTTKGNAITHPSTIELVAPDVKSTD